MKKRTGLGRGLEALIPTDQDGTDSPTIRQVPVEDITPNPRQPRTLMDNEALLELSASIKEHGLIQPLIVTGSSPAYTLIAGERRWRAAQMAGLESIPAVVREIPDEAAIAIALIENIQRENLNPVEEAMALQRLIDEFGMTHQQTADSVGRSRAAVSNLLRLLSLNADVRELVEQGQIDMGHARALLALSGEAQGKAARHVVDKDLSVRETERMVRRLLEAPAKHKTRPAAVDADIRILQVDLSGKLGAKVRVQHSKDGRGKLTIEYNSADELEGILAHIR